MLGVERIEVLLKPMVGRHTSVDDATNRLDRPFFTAQEASREGSRWLMEGPWCRVRRENGSKIQTNLNNSTSNDSNPQQARGTFVPT
jgi:hypothetical protein